MERGIEVVGDNELRLRLPAQPTKPQQADSVDAARQAVLDLNAAEERAGKDGRDKRTYGRTPGGTVFTVPTTHDMVSQLFSPFEPKNLSDAIVVTLLVLKVFAVITLPRALSVPLFAVLFLFWRGCYNGGIGWLLYIQSKDRSLVSWAKKSGIFEKPESGKNKHPQFYGLLKRELETKIPKDYKFEDAPLEYNTWLLFRRFVDLVLMSDFTSYCCFAAACGGTPEGEHPAMTATRWIIGSFLVLFNLWVKLDAHRVVKDFAWYWGDFFYLIDQELTFDGVFEMAPHPMYSVGYAGFYGISLMAASYRVLAISIVGHIAQFAFLAFVESPHIEKTYNPPLSRKRLSDPDPVDLAELRRSDSPTVPPSPSTQSQKNNHPPFVRDIVGLQNLDLHRLVDITSVLLQLYYYLFALMTPRTPGYQAFFVINAAVWRLWYSFGIGYILDRQSKKKSWTRHFIKWGDNVEEAWRQWKGIYHISMVMCYVSFVTAALKMYHLPADWQLGMSALRHVLGSAMIALQLWTFFSIYDSLGEFGWFFGDFFFERGPKLTYGGIYRFLNNPERIIGLAGVWGFALITWSKAIFFLAVLSHVLTLAFIQYVERPHMQKRYGQSIRQASGVSKTFTNSLPPALRKWHGNVDRALDDTFDILEDFIDAARPKLAAGVDTFFQETRSLFRQYPARISITRLAPDMAGYDSKDYSIQVLGGKSQDLQPTEKTSPREGLMARQPSFRGSENQPLVIEYGEPIRVRWTAPAKHSKNDWIGLYMLADVSSSREVTRISSQGRWVATSHGGDLNNPRSEQGVIESDVPFNHGGKQYVKGEVEFTGDKMWWTTGVFELRLHHAGNHNVMATSAPFEVRVFKFDDANLSLPSANNQLIRGAVEQTLLPLIRNCFDRDPDIAPNTVEEAFGGLVEREGKFARRVVFGIWQAFGIELAPAVVKSDGSVRNLAWRIINAKMVLAPYSMSNSKGASTPTEEAEVDVAAAKTQ